MILPKVRDPRFIREHRGGLLTEAVHGLLAMWAADCAEHVLPIYEETHPGDDRVRVTIDNARSWARGEVGMRAARSASFASKAAQETEGAAQLAARSASQAVVVSHVAAHELGAAAYAIRARMASVSSEFREAVRREERDWQRAQLTEEIRDLVLDDQRLRSPICWNVFD